MLSIGEIRSRLKVSQNQIASWTGRTQATVSRWESGKGPSPRMDEITAIKTQAIAQGLHWDDAWLTSEAAE